MQKGSTITGGLIILLLGICLLWWNEGNNVKNLESVNEGLKNYTDIKSNQINDKYENKLIATHGKLTTTSKISDDEFGISTDSAVLYRKVEMYQWEEDCEDEDNCTYNKVWSEELIDSSEFKQPGHNNPDSKLYESEKFINDNVMIGSFILPDKLVNKLKTNHKIKNLPEDIANNHSLKILNNNYYTNINETTEIGNIRISFYDNNTKIVSVLAKQSDDSFKIYKTKKGKDLFRIYEDNYDGYDMLIMISKSNNFSKWLWRIIGILLIIGGINSLFNPLTLIMNKIPILGNIITGASNVISFILGLSLSLIIIAIAWFRFRPLLSIILIIIVITLIIGLKIYSKTSKLEIKK